MIESGQTSSKFPRGWAPWVLAGVLSYWLAVTAVASPIAEQAASALHFKGVVAPAITFTLGYLLLRYWMIPAELRSWRSMLVLPLLVGVGTWLVITVLIQLANFLEIYAYQTALVQFWLAPLVVFLAFFGAAGAFFGVGLWLAEKLATRLALGPEKAALIGYSLRRAHTIGAIVVTFGQLVPIFLVQAAWYKPISSAVFVLVWPAVIPHLVLTWRAWRPELLSRQRSVGDIAGGVCFASFAIFLIGAGIRLSSSPDPVRALAWPHDYVLKVAASLGAVPVTPQLMPHGRSLATPKARVSSPSPGILSIGIGWRTKAAGLALQGNETIVVAATTFFGYEPRGMLLRLPASGASADLRITPVADLPNVAEGVAISPDEKIVVVGDGYLPGPDFLVARFLPSGMPDESFGERGWTLTDVGKHNDTTRGVEVQRDGRPVVTGISATGSSSGGETTAVATLRYNLDGSVDRSFGDHGRVMTQVGARAGASSVLVGSEGRITVFASAFSQGDSVVVRYSPDGELDQQFGRSGKAVSLGSTSYLEAAALDSQGRVVVVGVRVLSIYQKFLAVYDSEGNLDRSFGEDGAVALEFIWGAL